MTRGMVPKGQAGCHADQRGEGVEKEEDRGENRVLSGEVSVPLPLAWMDAEPEALWALLSGFHGETG